MDDKLKFGRLIKIGLVLLLVILPVAVVFGRDGGDTCATAVPITALPFNDTGDTTPNTNTLTSYSGTCTLPFPYGGEDQIYEITVGPGNSMDFSMDLTGSTGDLALFIVSNCGDGTSCVVNSQDAIGPGAGPEIITGVVLPPGTYYLYIDSYYNAGTSGSAGTFTLDITGTLGDVTPPPAPAIVLTKTVGLTAGTCATTDTINVPAGMGGTDVYYCYEVMNTGNITLSLHDLVDSELGTLLTGFPYDLGPGASVDSVAAGLEVSATITQTTVNTATWTAFNNSQETASASATATVNQNTPTSVSLSGFGEGGPSATPIWLGAIILLVAGLGFVMRRKLTA
jgi:hypothetical protein